ncbi:Shedu anti-phage system protein SduA domain-containing protein [Streptomyces sp. NPDC101194]|uniref:Shedu anti-phage system protein SduA domain-containing protein n=1 Tax=Streptomyces sp. NPDC101194 TaxID=3366127 RepID=UPI00382813BC
MDAIREAARDYFHQRRSAMDPRSSQPYTVKGPGDRLCAALVKELVTRGIDPAWIRVGRNATLPGAYRLGRWHLSVVKDGVPLGAITFKGLGGPALGNNYTNRISELTSVAFDVRREYASQELASLQPHLGLFFILEDSERANRPIQRSGEGYSAIGDGLSYKERLAEVFSQFKKDGLYDGICYVTSRTEESATLQEPHAEMSITAFVDGFVKKVFHLAEVQGTTGVTSLTFGEMLARRSDIQDVLTGLTSTPAGLLAAESAVIRRRRALVQELRALAMSEETNETIMHKALSGQHWIFGGQYIGVAVRRDLMNLHQHDIPLISADRSLNIIELKGPEAPLVGRPRQNHLILSSAVNQAVGQCMNYLRTLDEMGAALGTLHRNDLNLNYDYRRARATVVIGYPERTAADLATREQVDQTIRTYNAHLSRIQVLTYADLLDTAERALAFEEDSRLGSEEA